MKVSISIILLIVSFLFTTAQQRTDVKYANIKNNIAVEGYDVVAYFSNSPQKGIETNKTIYLGITYLFATKANKILFDKSPEKYKPQYGGWCAYAMGNSGEKVEVNPATFKIIDNKLYLFYNAYFTNTLKLWNKDEIKLKQQADKNWLNIINK